MSPIARFNDIKGKPIQGEIRWASNGLRRRIFDGRCWQYLCTGDPHCRLQAKSTCRFHKPTSLDQKPIHRSASTEHKQISPSDDIPTHPIQRMSLPNTSISATGATSLHQSLLMTRTRSRTKNEEKYQHVESLPIPATVAPSVPSSEPAHSLTENIFESVAETLLEKRELHTRNGRRVRCSGFIWKHLCANKKNQAYQRRTAPPANIDQILASDQIKMTTFPSDTMETSKSSVTQVKTRKKRKTMGDVNNEEHIIPKRNINQKRGKGSNKSIILPAEEHLSSVIMSDNPINDELSQTDVDLSLSIKPNRLNRNCQSTEIPLQSPLSFFPYDSSASAILEEFGTIIKKEVDDESFTSLPTIHSDTIDLPCETLQDFLRLEELKKNDFILDCQRIGYRLAKIQDCLGDISSMVS